MQCENLDHKKYSYKNYSQLVSKIDSLCKDLDQVHPMERKIKFLLDIRGYFKLNAIKGSYLEFGSYQSEMQYAAYKILDETQMITSYVGLDTFEGEPEIEDNEKSFFPSLQSKDFDINYDNVSSFVSKYIGNKSFLIKGDFRKQETLDSIGKYTPVAVSVIDCNLFSSIEVSIDYTLKNIVQGGIIFIDDYFSNMHDGIPRIHLLFNKLISQNKAQIIQHSFYPPFAKSFIVYKE